MVKYPHWVQKLLYYTAQHVDFDKCLSPRQTTANNCKTQTAFSLHVVESASDDDNF